MSTIILLRHGESTDVVKNIISGQFDAPLTDTGRLQAVEAAWKAARLGIRRIISSDLARARDTAEIIARELGLPPPETDSRLRERKWGEYEGRPHGTTPHFAPDEKPAGGESFNELRERVLAVFNELSDQTLVVSHAGSIRCILGACSLPEETLSPCGFSSVPGPSPESSFGAGEKKIFRLTGGIISRGDAGHIASDQGELILSGRVVYVTGSEDAARCCTGSLVLLGKCPKDTAVEALRNGSPAVNLTGALTAHLTCGRITMSPFVVAHRWLDGLPAEGEEISISVEQETFDDSLTPLPDILLRSSDAAVAERFGGKGAGLIMLEELGFRVPDYLLITTEEISHWMESGNALQEARSWSRRRLKEPDSLWAVRSSADTEDGENDSMSGSFDSLLNLSPEQVPQAILEIAESVNKSEIEERIHTGLLVKKPKMAIVVQRMVGNSLFAGAVFSPAPDDPRTMLLEANYKTSGDALMNGTRKADISARFDASANLIELNSHLPQTEKLKPFIVETARQALAIYFSSGRGDVEFAVDESGNCWWLQARPLNSMVVTVDRTNFHPVSRKYYHQIAFKVVEVNRIPPVYFRLINPKGAQFGYSVGILHRDILFSNLLKRNPWHLKEVTAYGWQVTEAIEKMAAEPERHNPEELLSLLTLHGAVQAPFAIPMSASRKERHNSWTAGETNAPGFLETVLEEYSRKFNIGLSGGDLLNRLRQPCRTSSVLYGNAALLELVQSPQTGDRQILECEIPDLRDVPDLSTEGMEKLRKRWLAKAEEIRSSREKTVLLEAEIQKTKESIEEINSWRAGLLKTLERSFPEEEAGFKLWVDYLLMKTEANEVHSICRGKALVYFAQTAFTVSFP